MNSIAPAGLFNLTRQERVIYGPGQITALAGEVERLGLGRALVVTGQTLSRSKLLGRVTGALGVRCAGVFAGARQHVPASTTRELAAQVERIGADCLVSFGGGSPIDTAKVAAHTSLKAGKPLVHIAVPTTLSAGEYTAGAGITDDDTLVKGVVRDQQLLARTVINDPELTLETPAWLWTATGMRALDHAIESIYAVNHQLISDTLASKAIALLLEHLPASIRTTGAEEIAHRGNCQLAAWLSIFGTGNVRFGLSHALGHQIGPRWNVPHGVTSCITLPHVMRLMAEVAPERFGPIAQGFGVAFDVADPRSAALACANRTQQFVADLKLPGSLSSAGVPREEITQIIDPVQHEVDRNQAVGRPISRQEIVALLEAAYE